MGNKIWTPATAKADPKRVVVKAEIVTAQYHAIEKALIIAVRLSNGKAKSLPDFPSNHSHFHGQPISTMTVDEIDREMEKTAELWREAKGRYIKVEVDETDLQ